VKVCIDCHEEFEDAGPFQPRCDLCWVQWSKDQNKLTRRGVLGLLAALVAAPLSVFRARAEPQSYLTDETLLIEHPDAWRKIQVHSSEFGDIIHNIEPHETPFMVRWSRTRVGEHEWQHDELHPFSQADMEAVIEEAWRNARG
jgi:hypothetical protein